MKFKFSHSFPWIKRCWLFWNNLFSRDILYFCQKTSPSCCIPGLQRLFRNFGVVFQRISLLFCLGPLLQQLHRFSRALGVGFVRGFNKTWPLELWVWRAKPWEPDHSNNPSHTSEEGMVLSLLQKSRSSQATSLWAVILHLSQLGFMAQYQFILDSIFHTSTATWRLFRGK